MKRASSIPSPNEEVIFEQIRSVQFCSIGNQTPVITDKAQIIRVPHWETTNMKSPTCEMLDIEFPLVTFSHCRNVVAEVSKSGGMGVLGAAGFNAEMLETELKWINDHMDSRKSNRAVIYEFMQDFIAAYQRR